jgi:hypothetical protein
MQGGAWLVRWKLVFTKQAQTDAKRIAQSGLKPQASRLLDVLKEDLDQRNFRSTGLANIPKSMWLRPSYPE